MSKLNRLLATDEFYEGKSENPFHVSLGLNLSVIKLAHLSVSAFKLLDPELVTAFTLEEQNIFARLLLKANDYLRQRGRKVLPLLRLSPRMLLPYATAPAISSPRKIEIFSLVENDDLKDNEGKSGNNLIPNKKIKKKLSRKQKLKLKEPQTSTEIPSTMALTAVPNDSMTEGEDDKAICSSEPYNKQLQQLSISPKLLSSLLQNVDLKLYNDILQICQEYEDLLSRQCEHWESISQSANLRLFIAENENNNLNDKVEELQLQVASLNI